MQYRLDSKSGNNLSALGFGCMRFPSTATGRTDIDAVEKLVLRAIDAGVTYFDTAYLYRGNEEALGAVFARNEGLRERIFLADKLPHMLCKEFSDFDRYFETSLERLGTPYIDYYLIHNVTDVTQWQRLVDLGILNWIEQKKRAGALRSIGFSYHGSEGDFAALLEAYDWDFCQIQYNYLNEHYQAGRAGLELAGKRGVPVIVMEPLLGGRLATALPRAAEQAFAQADPLATPAAWALRWVWNHPEVTVVLSGMNTEEQVAENAALSAEALPHTLDEQALGVIDKVRDIFSASYKVPCTGCNYCMPCPKGINIPACFASYNASFAHSWYTGVQQYVITVGALSEKPRLASDCIQCGACTAHCPQHIDVPEQLGSVRKRLQPPGFLAALKIGKKVMGR